MMKPKFKIFLGATYLTIGIARLTMALFDTRPTQMVPLVIAWSFVALGATSFFLMWRNGRRRGHEASSHHHQ
jgi:hypothetical protein